ncbi:hypothetical protein ACEWY4_019133 [Coilia grayii]|uniref:Cadherin Y-type LIR-motif domain-containing protein n=1 Tax=Coilia grayii TaxID=363190 RepID=A0ABD1JF65_9TELE
MSQHSGPAADCEDMQPWAGALWCCREAGALRAEGWGQWTLGWRRNRVDRLPHGSHPPAQSPLPPAPSPQSPSLPAAPQDYAAQRDSTGSQTISSMMNENTVVHNSTASIVGRRRRFSRLSQELYTLPIVVWDNGEPMLSGTSTLTLRVCPCQRGTRAKVCQSEAFLSSAGLSTGALIAILLCVLILLAIVILFITLRRSKKEPLIISEEDVRENVVTYDDEGGGEEDTEAFDISALRNPAAAEDLKFRRDIRPDGSRPPLGASLCLTPGPSHSQPHTPRRIQGRVSPASLDTEAELDICDFIRQRLAEADQDTSGPPYDSLQTYAFEGQGSPTGSISPLGSAGTQSELDYTFLDNWGPEFQKLAELYGEEVEKESTAEATEKP